MKYVPPTCSTLCTVCSAVEHEVLKRPAVDIYSSQWRGAELEEFKKECAHMATCAFSSKSSKANHSWDQDVSCLSETQTPPKARRCENQSDSKLVKIYNSWQKKIRNNTKGMLPHRVSRSALKTVPRNSQIHKNTDHNFLKTILDSIESTFNVPWWLPCLSKFTGSTFFKKPSVETKPLTRVLAYLLLQEKQHCCSMTYSY